MNHRLALITGAARRIGAGIVRHLHQADYRCVIHFHRSEQEALALAKELNGLRKNSALAVAADLQQAKDIEALINTSLAWAGRLDLLVNNASLFSADDRDWEALFAVNARAPYWLSQAAFPHLKLNHGSVVNITDVHSERPLKNYAVYCQSKAALALQTKALALEFAPDVRVNAVAPGSILWPEGNNSVSSLVQEKILGKTWLKRQGDPKNIAQAVLAFANNCFVTGQSLGVDGGRA